MLLIFAQLSGSKKKEIMENASAVIVVVFCASLPSPTYEFYMFLELILSKTYIYFRIYGKRLEKCAQQAQQHWKPKASTAFKHISSFRPFRTCSYEKHIIYGMFVLFSHNFIINVYHHYCSYSISHSSSCCQMKTLFPHFFFMVSCVRTRHRKKGNLGHEKRDWRCGKRMEPFLEIFAFRKDIF